MSLCMDNDRLEKMIDNFSHPMLIHHAHNKDRVFDFTLKGKKNYWETRFAFDTKFPFSLPKVKLWGDGKEYIGKISHVNIKGVLCIDESDSVLVDYKAPEALIGYTIEKAVKLLEFGSLKINRMELIDEYEGYFQHISAQIPGHVTGTDTLKKIYLKMWYPKNGKKSDGEPFFIHDSDLRLPDRYSNLSKTSSFQTIKALYIPTGDSISMLSLPREKCINVKYIDRLVASARERYAQKITKLAGKFKPSKQFYLLFGIPRSNGTRSLILFRLKFGTPTPHPIKESKEGWEITPYLINRHNKEYLLERGGADFSFFNTKVAIIGCGSVGSEVSTMLAKAGVGNLTLIDHDFLEVDNIYRHRIGGSGLNYLPDSKTGKVFGWNKARFLSLYLERELPHIKVKAVPKPIEEIIDGDELQDTDVIISAVGSPSLNLFLNGRFKELGFKKIIYCWNEASSVGGHALAVDLDSSCFECQFCRSESFTLVSPIDLVIGGQHLTKNLTGCAGVFTPFSYLDSSQTAIIATRLCMEVIKGMTVNKIVSWKNPNIDGLQLTERYYEMDLLEEHTYKNSACCRICGHG